MLAANRQIVAAAQFSSGPLPSAEQLIKYKEAHPDAPERILKLAEKQAEHRQKLEGRVVRWDIIRSTMGLFFAFVIVLLAIYVSWNLISTNHEWAGVGLFGTTLASVVASFIYGTKTKQPQRQ